MATLPPLTPNTINRVSLTDSKLLHVSLYTDRAELRRLFKLSVQKGQNQFYINGLPIDIYDDSLRVQRHGDATIRDVSLSFMPREPGGPDYTKTDLIDEAIFRCQAFSRALERYIDSMNVVDVPLGQVGDFINTCSAQGSKLDEELARLRKEETELHRESRAEKPRMVAVDLFAESEGEVEIELVYAVSSAGWEAVYDIHVGLEAKNPLTVLVYKAAIFQYTGEDWTDVPLTLETATPSYSGAQTLKLKSLKLSDRRPYHSDDDWESERYQPYESILPSRSRTPSRRRPWQPRHRSFGLNVVSKGDGRFNHTVFQVPGLISVAGNGRDHKITVVELKELETKLWWLAVPKSDTSVLLNAKIKNTSQYALMPGSANVYVDGTFISSAQIPAAGPGETIDCSLGSSFESSVKITYHPISSETSHHLSFSGLKSLRSFGFTKTTSTLYSQRITILNTKSVPIDELKLLDRIPVSETERITVRILEPAELNKCGKSGGVNNDRDETESNTLVTAPASKAGRMKRRFSTGKMLPSFRSGSGIESLYSSTEKTGATASVATLSPAPVQSPLDTGNAQITAQWDSADADKELPGSRNRAKNDGKIRWLLYDIPAQGTVNLVTKWEVSAASSKRIFVREE
ncbi:hypothetical protein GYMLUDRAFT_44439 [Collybiopsis luxurians FD-317 M1]|uniref:Mucoidy inhibitor A n=1 Tax=Collybiopsis luxurians FD-317 M1 TaxID=944289 RepID=A0A0D0BV91_9AGAR|nr:hypothetical protein GYMLUDRAFT_44439 [Collybiopsis luxurians FD-317 M1]